MTDPSDIWEDIWVQLKRGTVDRRHPWRYFSLSTITPDNQPRIRTVVLREVYDIGTLVAYTDSRSQKVKDLSYSKSVGLLFFHPKRMLQLVCQGEMEVIVTDPPEGYTIDVLKDYRSRLAPGTTIKDPSEYQLGDRAYFALCQVKVHRVEYLSLSRSGHRRIAYTKGDDDWSHMYLVP